MKSTWIVRISGLAESRASNQDINTVFPALDSILLCVGSIFRQSLASWWQGGYQWLQAHFLSSPQLQCIENFLLMYSSKSPEGDSDSSNLAKP